jgi:pimeloyl-ACP methyl ester carboxylesterase
VTRLRRPRSVALTAALAGALVVTACSSGGSTFIDQAQPRSNAAAPGGTRPAAPSSAPAPTPTPATPTVGPVQFSDCTSVIKPQVAGQEGGDRDLTFGCGRLRVPLDYTDPDGESVQIFVLRVHLAAQTQRIGSLLINPGGPGGSGLDAAVGLGLALPVELLKRFDLVGFDPRGVGLSGPLECVPDALKDRGIALDPDATTTAQYAAQVAVARDSASSCSGKYGASLVHYNTEETARDMELIRQAVGDDKLSYLGYSYGTRLGSVYADLFPTKVRALVLDGAVDPDQDDVSAAETQARGFENAYSELTADCARRGSACPIGPDAKASLRAVLAQARRAPIPSGKSGETRKATSGYVLLAAISALYDQGDWNDLENALAQARNGDSQGVLSLADRYSQRDAKGHYTNIVDASLTINCTDSSTKITDAVVRAKVAEWRTKYPLFGTSLALGMLSCAQWTGPRHPLPRVTGTGAPPILVIGTTNDPATPYASARVMARRLKSGVLLTWDGEGHTAYPKTKCVTSAVDAYLISLKAPKPGTRCPRS